MKISQQEQEALTSLMTRLYHEIREIEEQYQLLVGEGDFRVRIEYFYDAVRAFSAQHESPETRQRLSVEMLAYDLTCLRYIQSKPLAGFKPSARPLSTGSDLVPRHGSGHAGHRPDRETKQKIADLYKYYTVLFAALFKPIADRDHLDRLEEVNQAIEDIAQIVNACESLAQGGGSVQALMDAINHLDDSIAVQMLTEFVHKQKHKDRQALNQLIASLKDRSQRIDHEGQVLDSAHMNYSMAQLGVYEEGKDLVKRMAQQGMNVAGKFVESAMAAAVRDAGRGM